MGATKKIFEEDKQSEMIVVQDFIRKLSQMPQDEIVCVFDSYEGIHCSVELIHRQENVYYIDEKGDVKKGNIVSINY